MSRDLYPAIISAIDGATVEPFLAVQFEFDLYTLRLWNGYGTKSINGSDFVGVGTLLGVSDISETSELAAVGATVTLSGVPSDMLSIALTEQYQGRRAHIYLGVLTNSGAWLLESGVWRDTGVWDDAAYWGEYGTSASQIFSGYLDQMVIDEQAETSVIAVTIESRLIDLERVRVYNYSSATQKAEYPNDLGFDFVDSLQGKTYNWGRT